MKRIIAVSGGVDSVVLLDTLVNQYGSDQLVVAHFEHGIRGKDSIADALFVEKLSQNYRVKYEIGHGNLTKNVSEAEARKARYRFLRTVAKTHKGTIVTAHHKDDLVETIALNISRGTGWRGLAVLDSGDIERPLLNLTKKDIYDYALEHQLEWVEDETNQMDRYTRNRLRRILWQLSAEDKECLLDMYESQKHLKGEIDRELRHFGKINSRYFMTMVPVNVGLELLRHLVEARLTRPQLSQLLLAIKTARPGSRAQVGGGISVKFSDREFSLESIWSD